MTSTDSDLVRLSASDLWQRQKDFYCREGIGAWQGKIPFYATSNAFIANAYAQLIFAYLEDRRVHGSESEPAAIIELGAGPGLFAYYLVRRLDELVQTFAQPPHEFVYVLTDVAQANIDHWCHHPAWEPYIAAGKVDFAHFDLAHDADLTLEVSGLQLSASDAALGPLIAIANYVFDSIPVDLFRTHEGELQEGLVPRSPQFESGEATNAAVTLEEIDSAIHYRRATLPYYEDTRRDALLRQWAEGRPDDQHLCMPIAAMGVLDTLTQLSGGQLLLLASDKGYAGHHDIYANHEAELVLHHDAHSFMVNFHTLGEYCQAQGGDCFHQRTQLGLATSVFLAGASFAEFPRTHQALHTHVGAFSPGDLFRVYSHLAEVESPPTLESLLSYLNVLQWDLECFNQHFDLLMAWVGEADVSAARDLAEGISRAAESYYHVSDAPDTLINLGLILEELGEYERALECFEQAARYDGDAHVLSYHSGLCLLGLEHYAMAVERFETAVAADPHSVLAKGWLAQARELLEEVEKR